MTNLQELLANLPKRKQAVRKVKPVYRHDYKQRYHEAHRLYMQREYPSAYQDHGGFKKEVPDVNKTNGLQKYIREVMNYLGHFGERVSTQGVAMRVHGGKVEYRKGSATVGSADIHCHLKLPGHKFAIPWKIEVKRGKDVVSKAQERYAELVTSSGSLHCYVKNIDDFWDYYDYALSL